MRKLFLLLILSILSFAGLKAQQIDPRQIKKADSLIMVNPISTLPDVVVDIHDDINNKVDSISEKVDTFELRIDSFNLRLDTVELEVDTLNTRIDSVVTVVTDPDATTWLEPELVAGNVNIEATSNRMTFNWTGVGNAYMSPTAFRVNNNAGTAYIDMQPGFFTLDNTGSGSVSIREDRIDAAPFTFARLGNYYFDTSQDTTGTSGYVLTHDTDGEIRLLDPSTIGSTWLKPEMESGNVSIDSDARTLTFNNTVGGDATYDASSIYIQSASGNAYLDLSTTRMEISDESSRFAGITPTSIYGGDFTSAQLGNFNLDVDQVVGAGTDDYVLTYDNGTGLISLEENAAATDTWLKPELEAGVVSIESVANTLTLSNSGVNTNVLSAGNITINNSVNGNLSDIDPGVIELVSNAGTNTLNLSGTTISGGDLTTTILGNYVFDVDQAIGAGQDNYVLTYDNVSGEISLEAAAGGGGDNLGDHTATQDLDVNSNDILLGNTTIATLSGIIRKGGNPFFHDFNYGNNGTVTTEGNNLFIGEVGNLTAGSTATSTFQASRNIFIGNSVGLNLTTGYRNIAIGTTGTLTSNTTGRDNIAIGDGAMAVQTTAYGNIAIGSNALANETSVENTAIGLDALRLSVSGFNNTAVGYEAMENCTTCHDNTAIGGYRVMFGVTTGDNNAAVGREAMSGIASGRNNSALGHRAGISAADGDDNVYVGYQAGRFINSGSNMTGGDRLILIGSDARTLTAADSNAVVIGYAARGKGDNTVVIGNTDIQEVTMQNFVLNTDQDTTGLGGQALAFNSSTGQIELTQIGIGSRAQSHISGSVSGSAGPGTEVQHNASTGGTVSTIFSEGTLSVQADGDIEYAGANDQRAIVHIDGAVESLTTGDQYLFVAINGVIQTTSRTRVDLTTSLEHIPFGIQFIVSDLDNGDVISLYTGGVSGNESVGFEDVRIFVEVF